MYLQPSSSTAPVWLMVVDCSSLLYWKASETRPDGGTGLPSNRVLSIPAPRHFPGSSDPI